MGVNKKDLLSIYKESIKAVDPIKLINTKLSIRNGELIIVNKKKINTYKLNRFKKIFIIGAGKAAARMAFALEKKLVGFDFSGIVSVKYGYTENLKHIKIIQAGHPLPDRNSLVAGKKVLKIAKQAEKDMLVIGLISGGGSSLLCNPDKISFKEKIKLTQKLLKDGSDIKKINQVRKKYSKIKGGNLGKAILPATSLNLILSDVVGDDVETIASGLTCYKHSSIKNIIIGNNIVAKEACKTKSLRFGFNPRIIKKPITDDCEKAAHTFFNLIKKMLKKSKGTHRPICVIAGGETTVKVRGNRQGGRCQHMVLLLMKLLLQSKIDLKRIHFLSGGTDGCDGPTPYAGAYLNHLIMRKAKKMEPFLDEYITNCDSTRFLKSVGALIKIGPTNTNVGDIHILIIK